MDNEIVGLDTEVLLNAKPLEEGEQAAVDLKEPQTAHPPPSQTSHTPHTLQQTLPPSMQVSISTINSVQQLVQVLLAISQNMAVPPPPKTPPPHTQHPPTLWDEKKPPPYFTFEPQFPRQNYF